MVAVGTVADELDVDREAAAEALAVLRGRRLVRLHRCHITLTRAGGQGVDAEGVDEQ